MGLRSPSPRQLEAGHCSPTAQRWVARTMTQNFIFPPFITLSCLHSHSVTLPLVYHRSFEHHWGCREGAAPPAVGGQGTKRFLVNLWILSFRKKVFPGCRGGEPPCKRNRFTESKLRTNNIWDYTPNDTFAKTRVSLCAEAEILQYTRVRNSDQLQAGYINGAKARSKERKIRIGALTARSFSSVISSQMFWVRRKSSLTLETIGDR